MSFKQLLILSKKFYFPIIMLKNYHLIFILLLILISCKDDVNAPEPIIEDPSSFAEVGQIDIGGTAAAEISAFDPSTNRLFVVNNDGTSRIDVIDLSTPSSPKLLQSIGITQFGAGVNSVAVKDGLLAATIEANPIQNNGTVAIFNTSSLALVQNVAVGALPDMVTFSPDGAFIVTANEGEPNTSYSNDPEGTISVISVKNNFAANTLSFASFEPRRNELVGKGLRIFGPGASLAKDLEPEYVAISQDSKTAWVTLQENNGIAKVDLVNKSIVDIYPLGFKNHNNAANGLDASDQDSKKELRAWPVRGMYQPDAIAFALINNNPYVITADEGDAREYMAITEERRVSALNLDPTAFPTATELKLNANLGRLGVTNTLGDTDGDGDFDILYAFGARSFSIWNANDLSLAHNSGNELESRLLNLNAAIYDDTRSDNKGAEPEGVTVGTFQDRTVAFVGLERADAVMIYDISTPTAPTFLQLLTTGDAPEGVLYVKAEESPNRKSMLIVSSEGDGLVKIFQPQR